MGHDQRKPVCAHSFRQGPSQQGTRCCDLLAPASVLGTTAIWISGMAIYSVYYMKSDFFSEGIKGYDWLNEHYRVPNVADLTTSHAYLITIESETLEDVYFKMQGESWCPKGEARELTASEGLRHTSMAVGDIAIDHS